MTKNAVSIKLNINQFNYTLGIIMTSQWILQIDTNAQYQLAKSNK